MVDGTGGARRVHDGVRTQVVGNLTGDPVRAITGEGKPWAHFTIASNERTQGADGSWESRPPVYTEVSVFAESALAAVDQLHRGDRVEAVGRPRVRVFDRADGTPGAELQVTAFSVTPAPLPKRDSSPASASAGVAAGQVPEPLPAPAPVEQPSLGV